MLLIQTALEQEFRAVASILERTSDAAGQGNRAAARIYGRIAEHPCWLVKTGIGGQRAERELQKALGAIARPHLVLSIGLAGGLASECRVGQPWLIRGVSHAGREPVELSAALHLLAPEYRQGAPAAALVSVDQPAFSAQAKQELHRASGASLCDMETHAVARVAVAHGVPWMGGRVVSDTADESLPSWCLNLPGLIERRAWAGVVRQLATHPQDLPGLLRLAVRMRTLERQLAHLTLELIRNVLRS